MIFKCSLIDFSNEPQWNETGNCYDTIPRNVDVNVHWNSDLELCISIKTTLGLHLTKRTYTKTVLCCYWHHCKNKL